MLSLTGLRRKLIEAIPSHLKVAITCGIGLFIAFIGLKNGGLIEADPATFVRLARPATAASLLVLFGIGLAAVLVVRRWRGAIIISVLALTVIALFVPGADGKGRLLGGGWGLGGWRPCRRVSLTGRLP
jgi:AGZA family xanthine/uracil permease-like MFS transporter